MYHITTEIESAILSATPKQVWEHNKAAIVTLSQIKPGTQPTKDQLDALAKFNGWGAVPQVFSANPEGWAKNAQADLRQLLGIVEYARASESILNAHYTSPEVIRSIWSLVQKLGFTGGRILEPSCGVGYFLGLMPDDIYRKSEIVGVELDPVVAAIASHLYPEASIYAQGFESVQFPDGHFDLAIGNVPFGSYGVLDPRYDYLKLSIHNYFLAKCTDLVRPGGFVVLITSPYTLDAPSSQHFREWLAGKQIGDDDDAEVIGAKVKLQAAIRLPAGIFKQVAGTMVSPDILVLQRIDNGIDPNPDTWTESHQCAINSRHWPYTTECDSEYGYANLNRYFVKEFSSRSNDKYYLDRVDSYRRKGNDVDADYWQHQVYAETHHLLGVPAINKLYGEGFALESDNRNLPESIDCIASELICWFTTPAFISQSILVPPSLQHVKDLSFCKGDDGKIYQRHDGQLVLVNDTFTVGKLTVERVCDRIQDFWKLRGILDKVIAAQSSSKNLANYQQALKLVYDHFVSKWGKVNDRRNLAVLGQDPRYYLVRTLEREDGVLADIFTKRVCREYQAPHLAANPTDALVHSLNTHGKLDLEFMSGILGNPPIQKIVDFLESKGTIFFDPDQNNWVLAEQYLSGNVYQKLQDAISANLSRNIEALKAIQPAPMLPQTADDIKIACLEALGIDWSSLDDNAQAKMLSRTIKVRLGTNWIPAKVYKQFAAQVLKISCDIKYLAPPVAAFVVNGYSSDTTQYGTGYLDSSDILERGLNLKDPRVVVKCGENIDLAASNEATEDARNKLREMRQAFLDWVWQDKERAVQLCLHYNQHINVNVERSYNGSWLQLPGSNPDIQLRPWQLNAIARVLENNSTFLAHDVGLGKSFVMIASIMECRRLGLTKKPMLVVLNGTEKQIESDWRRLYPMANVLVPKFKDAESRKLFTAQIKTADFDGVILTHSQFFSLAMSTEYQLAFLQQEKDLLEDFLKENKSDRMTDKNLMRCLKNVEIRIRKVSESVRKDNHIDFEGLTDMLVMDEAHCFKNLAVVSKMSGIRGIPTSYSQRATDTYMKILHTLGNMLTDVSTQVKGKVVLATGTILSNTMAEVFNWQRMMQLPALHELQLDHFDSWASQFGETITGAEITPTGQYKVNTRFKSFVNLQVLKGLMGQFVDIMTVDMVGDQLERPEAKFVDVIVPPSEAQLNFLRNAVKRADDIKNRKVSPDEDNMLKITTDLTKAALSMRLMGETTESPESKLHECAWNVWQVWKSTSAVKGTQLVFCDFSTPKSERYNIYYYLRDLLIALGIPAQEIAFIHDHDKTKRAALFEKVNAGEVRILMGSTGKLGTGCNVHKNGLWAMHHVDAPWRPSDIEQREGRGIRQGNGEYRGETLKSVWSFRYVTERLDALRWQTLQWKQEMIKKFMNGHDLDSVDDCDQAVYSYAQVKSLATGNPLLIEDTNLRSELASLLMLQCTHDERQSGMKFEVTRWTNRIGVLLGLIDNLESDINYLKQNSDRSQFAATFITDTVDVVVNDAKAAGESFVADCNKLLKDKIFNPSIVCRYRGFDVLAWATMAGHFNFILKRTARYDLPLKFATKSFSISLHKPDSIFKTIDAVLAVLPEYLEYQRSQLEIARTEQVRCESQQGKAFSQAARLVEVRQRLDEIAKIMAEDEAALGVKAASGDDEFVSDSDSEDDDDKQFWLQNDSSIAYTGVDAEIVKMLKARSSQCEWLQELNASVTAF